MTDPVTIAREVLDLTHEDETVTVCSVPDNKVAALARAVIDLTAKVKRVEELADRLEREAAHRVMLRDYWAAGHVDAEATRVRDALNGETA